MNQELIRKVRALSDEALQAKLRELAGDERKLQTAVLWHLREAELRRLYAKRGYSSLFDYVVKELGYAESAAFRRISAMRLLREFPELEAKLESGTIKLSQVAALQSFVRSEERIVGKAYSSKEKRDLILRIENMSHRETMTELSKSAASGLSVVPDQVRNLGSGAEIRFFADTPLLRKFERVKEVAAHRLRFTNSYSDLFHVMGDLALDRWDPMRKAQGQNALPTSQPTEKVPKSEDRTSDPSPDMSPSSSSSPLPSAAVSSSPSSPPTFQPSLIPTPARRFIPERIRQLVWKRDQGQCQYRDPLTAKVCGSRFGLQIDHIQRIRDGGTSLDSKNLRLLCGPHNRLRG